MQPSQLPPPHFCQICAKYVGAPPPGSHDGKTDCVDANAQCVPPSPYAAGIRPSAELQPYIVRENGHLFLRAPKKALN